MSVIVKLNDPSGNFFDSTNGQTISGSDVVEMIETEKVATALKNGHLRKATADEIKEFKAKAPKVEEPKKLSAAEQKAKDKADKEAAEQAKKEAQEALAAAKIKEEEEASAAKLLANNPAV